MKFNIYHNTVMKKIKIAKLIFLIVILTICCGISFSQSILEDKYKLALSLEKSGEFSKAEEIYSEIYSQNKNRYEFFLGLVRCKKALNKFSEILPLLEEQLQARKTLELLLIGSEVSWHLGNYEKAKLYWSEAVRTYSKNDSTYIKVALQQSNLKQFKLAIETFLLGRRNLNSKSLFFDDLINLYMVVGDFERAVEEILSEYERSNNINWAQAKISLFIENKEARKVLEQKLKKPKSGFEILYKYLYAWLLYSIKEFHQSFEIYKEIDKLVDSKGYEIYRFANTALNDGEYEVALRAFEYLVSFGKRTNYLVSSIYGLAKVMDLKLLNQINIERSVVSNVINKYEQALQEISSSNPLYFEIKYRIAQLYYIHLKDYSKAEKILLDLIKTKNNPLLWKTHLLLGDVYLCQYNFNNAEWQYNFVIGNNSRSKTDEYFLGLLKLGKANFYQSNFDSAQYYYLKLIEDSPSEIANEVIERSFIIEKFKQYNYSLSLFAQAELFLEMNKLDSAILVIDQAIKKVEGTNFEEYLVLSKIRIMSRYFLFDKSEAFAKTFLEKFPKSIYLEEVIYLLGYSQYQQQKNIEAINTLVELLTKYPRSIFNPKARLLINELRKKES